ncbi:hypothetical protein M595_4743 [Lyngbya aestuarii BL J]|uniref:Uncharacterized protein n=1 Tax=Lyngbya aestuarii BL J TaxID=1348334 RepID=U7QDL3_9CYAN|nr:hypothetical protein M595_4743 [Lyngbya aestuarii BL J]
MESNAITSKTSHSHHQILATPSHIVSAATLSPPIAKVIEIRVEAIAVSDSSHLWLTTL